MIGTDELFSLVGLIFGKESLEQFEIFWGIAWFTVVKGWHVTEFAILTAGLIGLLNVWRPTTRMANIFVAAALALLFAASDEFHQTFVPTRGGTIWDVLIDSLGVGLVTLFSLMRLRRVTLAQPPLHIVEPVRPPT
ncbi:MAG: hypothetical protein JWP89_249 [Schlesneria sp.]|nr:hypothetical protein [Schlesneria sp.]